ncbi:restriction endonuclease [archaeon]|jgi:type II restriction enzyme|nr:restriction endonuclease [archaeon]MBT7381298.1 restriction endonuclease [archaeon]MBT7507765.1 restriction endonuclease [archaeon]
MKYLQTYKKLKLKEDEKDIFKYLIETLTDSIFTWDYFVGFEKVKKNIHLVEKELNLLNVLIGKDDIEKELISLISEYPNVRKVLPILIAIRNNKLKDLKIIDDFEELKSESKIDLFNPTKELTSELKEDLINFFKESGLKDIFQDKDVKSIVDYCFGVEVGMDTNARKNRTGQSMESIVENIIQKFAEKNNLDYIPQATQKKIKEKWNFDIELDKTNRIFDFAVFEKTKNKIFIIETNYYGGGGSKLKSTAGEYQYLSDFLKKQGIDLIWITDGLGWKTTKKSLFETFLHNDYLLNIELVKQGTLKDIIL